MIELLRSTPTNLTSDYTLVFAHGAGAPMDSVFMERVTEAIALAGIEVVRFEFPYMQERRATGKKRPPDRAPKLLASFVEVIEACGGFNRCVLAGKSMGGRMATMLAAENVVPATVVFGYPFHPQGKMDKPRIEHLQSITSPITILQGERDPLGKPEEVAAYSLSTAVEVIWMEDGDHDLTPRKKKIKSL